MREIMLDLETLGTRPGSVVFAVGAVFFGPEGLGSTFYRRIDIRDAQACGLTIDAETVRWWMQQSDAARAEFAKEGDSLAAVTSRFAQWLDENTSATGEEETLVWGNGATFDNALWEACYHALGMKAPWEKFADRCYRTEKARRQEIQIERGTGTHHNALDDAVAQAKHLLAIRAADEWEFKSLLALGT